MVGAAAEFAVGGELEADALLQRQRLADRPVLGGGQRGLVDLAAAEADTFIEQ